MIVRKLQKAEHSNRRVISPDGKWESTRLLLKDDKMGFSFHITTIYEGSEIPMHYTNHYESVYCISGEGEIVDLAEGKTHPIGPGTIYILNNHDRHILRAFKEMKMACVFNPPLNGKEVHNAEGAYDIESEAITD